MGPYHRLKVTCLFVFIFYIKLTDDQLQGLGFDWISRSSQVNLQCIVRINELGAPLSVLAVTFLAAEVLLDQIKIRPSTWKWEFRASF